MPPISRNDHRCPAHVTMPLSDAAALGRIAETWANLAPEVLAGEFQTENGTISVNTTSGRVTYAPRPEYVPF